MVLGYEGERVLARTAPLNTYFTYAHVAVVATFSVFRPMPGQASAAPGQAEPCARVNDRRRPLHAVPGRDGEQDRRGLYRGAGAGILQRLHWELLHTPGEWQATRPSEPPTASSPLPRGQDLASSQLDGCWRSRKDPSHEIRVGSHVRFEVKEVLCSPDHFSLLGGLEQEWTGDIDRVPPKQPAGGAKVGHPLDTPPPPNLAAPTPTRVPQAAKRPRAEAKAEGPKPPSGKRSKRDK